MNWEGIAALAGIVVALGTLAGFLSSGYKSAVERGRLLQRVDQLEADNKKLSDRMACVEDGHTDTREQFAAINEKLKTISDQIATIFTMLERRARGREGD